MAVLVFKGQVYRVPDDRAAFYANIDQDDVAEQILNEDLERGAAQEVRTETVKS